MGFQPRAMCASANRLALLLRFFVSVYQNAIVNVLLLTHVTIYQWLTPFIVLVYVTGRVPISLQQYAGTADLPVCSYNYVEATTIN